MSNGDSSANITVFNWNEFPVEKDKFCVCICLSEIKSQRETLKEKNTDKILNYVKLIFPEENLIYTNIHDLVNYRKNITNSTIKSTLIFNIDDLSDTDWTENIAILGAYLDRGYFIIIGNYDKIPKILTTTCDIMIFDTEDTTNKYMLERHNSKISNFNTESHYILIDKRNLNLKIHGLSKEEINRYN